MSETMQRATTDVLVCLETMTRERMQPSDAQRHLREVQVRHPDVVMELVWEEETYDGSVHYDALLRAADGRTVSLSSCAAGALPWPLRGVRRWSDADLAQVNGRILKIQDAVGFLDLVWNEAPIMDRMIDVCLVREELDRHPIEITDAELQRGMDDLRRAHKLHDAAATHRWMEQRGLTHERLELLVADNLTIDRLRERIAEGRVETCFEATRAELDTVQVARIECADEASARRLHGEIVAGEIDFFAAAQRQFLAAPNRERTLFVTLRRRELAAEVGETRVDGRVVTRVLSVVPAQLDEPTRAAIKDRLLEEWLAERKGTANITWFWGTADRAA